MAKNELSLLDLELSVYLGWPEKEREQTQKVLVDILFSFSDDLAACTSDHLNDTVCYDTLVNSIHRELANKKFRLVEYLAKYLHQYILDFITLTPGLLLTVSVNKFPLVPGLTRGAKFSYKG